MQNVRLIYLSVVFSGLTYGQNLLINPGFELSPTGSAVQSFAGGSINTYLESDITGWNTTANDDRIEIWSSASGVLPYEGNYFAEINANSVATLYQDVSMVDGTEVDFLFSHRGRTGVDYTRFSITYNGADDIYGTADDQVMVDFVGGADSTAWEEHWGHDVFTSEDGTYRFAFEALSTANGNDTTGNFLDAFAFGEGVADHLGTYTAPIPVPEPSQTTILSLLSLALVTNRKRTK